MKNILKLNLEKLNQSIDDTCKSKSRDRQTIKLLAISKQQTSEKIKQLYNLGISAFGESYLIEAQKKQRELSTLQIEWHFIGTIQSNKTKMVAEKFDWVHSPDRLSIAKHLSRKRPAELKPLNVCIQVNISRESNKSGCMPEALLNLVSDVNSLSRLRLRGLMIIPEAVKTRKNLAAPFENIRRLFDLCRNFETELDTLSMGMSDDFELAIEHGSTMVRLGTVLFGSRNR